MDEIVVRGKLKLKKTSGGKVEKKKSKPTAFSPEKTEAMIAAGGDGRNDSDNEAAGPSSSSSSTTTKKPVQPTRVKTKAEMAFEKRQADMQTQRIEKKAQVSHRERVEKFNQYLGNLTEINDIPKVSWTK